MEGDTFSRERSGNALETEQVILIRQVIFGINRKGAAGILGHIAEGILNDNVGSSYQAAAIGGAVAFIIRDTTGVVTLVGGVDPFILLLYLSFQVNHLPGHNNVIDRVEHFNVVVGLHLDVPTRFAGNIRRALRVVRILADHQDAKNTWIPFPVVVTLHPDDTGLHQLLGQILAMGKRYLFNGLNPDHIIDVVRPGIAPLGRIIAVMIRITGIVCLIDITIRVGRIIGVSGANERASGHSVPDCFAGGILHRNVGPNDAPPLDDAQQ